MILILIRRILKVSQLSSIPAIMDLTGIIIVNMSYLLTIYMTYKAVKFLTISR